MRVVCVTIDDFLENLDKEPKEAVYRGIIYVDVIRQPIDSSKRNAARFSVVFQASAVIDVKEGQFLLEMSEDCGTDYNDATQEMIGTNAAKGLKEILEKYCSEKGLVVRPGVVDF